MAMTTEELNALPTGAQVQDNDDDLWTKQFDGLWSFDVEGGYYSNWTSERLSDWYGGVHPVAPQSAEAATAETTIEGVWIVWDSTSKTSINGLFPADAEINALRMVNRNGYGHAEFTPFGEV